MDRRKVIEIALKSGAVVLLSRLPLPDALAVDDDAVIQAAAVEFQQGTLHGGEFEGWQALLASTGKVVRGTIYDPKTAGDARFTGYRIRGTKRGTLLDLDFFDLDDLDFSDPVGGGRGGKKRGKTTVNFSVLAAASKGRRRILSDEDGKLVSKPVVTPPRAVRQVAGRYGATIVNRETGDLVGGFSLTADRAGRFAVTGINVPGNPAAPQRVAGRYGVGHDGTVFAVMALPKLDARGLSFDPSEVQVLRPSAASGRLREEGFDRLFSPLIAFCAAIQCNHVVSLTVAPRETDSDNTALATVTLFKHPVFFHAEVVVSSSNPEALRVPESVSVETGKESAQFLVFPQPVTQRTEVTIRAVYGSSDAEATLIVNRGSASPPRIIGKVTDPAGHPQSGASVVLDSGAQIVPTSSDGAYAIPGVAPGYHILQASKPGFLPSAPVQVAVGPGPDIHQDLQISRGGHLSGKVHVGGPTGPAIGAQIELFSPAGSGRLYLTGDTNAAGLYDFGPLPVGTYDLRASEPGYLPGLATGIALAEEGAAQRDLVLTPDDGAGEIRGVVRQASGNGISATVELLAEEGGILGSVITSGSGDYLFPGLLEGIYGVRAGASHFQTQMKTGLAVVGRTRTRQDFTLVPGEPTAPGPARRR